VLDPFLASNPFYRRVFYFRLRLLVPSRRRTRLDLDRAETMVQHAWLARGLAAQRQANAMALGRYTDRQIPASIE
jgi:hypothetical protein